MSKKYKRIMEEVAARWQETLTSPTVPDLAPAKKLLVGKSRTTRVFVVDSPLQFYIGQAIVRGRLSKATAKEYCAALGIDAAFVGELTRVGGLRDVVSAARSWDRQANNTLLDNMLNQHAKTIWFSKEELEKREKTRRHWRSRRAGTDMQDVTTMRMSDLHMLYATLISPTMTGPISGSRILHHVNFNTNAIARSLFTIMDAVSNTATDIVSGQFDPTRHMYDAVHAEIMCRMLNCKDPGITKHFEIFHYTSAMMKFNDAYMILGAKPKISLNAEENMHCETGKAVEWADGSGLWFIDGHILRERGEQIVMHPETLTADDIRNLRNEEERRVAIDRLGWGKFLASTGADVVDRRANWVDNTIEVLINPPKSRKDSWAPEEPLRMVLACRSTGRKYFIAVPRVDRLLEFSDDPAGVPIQNCEQAQNWLANGAVTPHLAYANKPLNIVGAS